MTSDDELMAKAARIRDLAEEKWVKERVMKYRRADGSVDEDQKHHDEQVAESKFDWVIREFQWFTEMSAADCTGIATQLNTVKQALGQVNSAEITSLKGILDNWWGRAASDYRTNFLAPFELSVANQQAAIQRLEDSMNDLANYIKEARRAIHAIADETVAALDAIYNSGGASKRDSVKFLLALASAGIALTPALAPGTFMTTLVAGSLNVVSSAMVDTKVSGPGTEPILDAMMARIRPQRQSMRDLEHALAAALDKDVITLKGAYSSTNKELFSPNIEDPQWKNFDPKELRPNP